MVRKRLFDTLNESPDQAPKKKFQLDELLAKPTMAVLWK